MLKIKIKKIHPYAVIPKYAHQGDAGMDIVAVEKKVEENYIEYKTGLSFEIPEGHCMLIYPRSSVANTGLIMANCVGVLDSGFRGELKIRFRKLKDKEYEVGERIAQLIVLPYPKVEFEEVSELSETERGDGSYGSTGR